MELRGSTESTEFTKGIHGMHLEVTLGVPRGSGKCIWRFHSIDLGAPLSALMGATE